MKINDIIVESNRYYLRNPQDLKTMAASFDSAENIYRYIAKHCSQMLQAYKATGRVLYRGMHSEEPIVKSVVRPDRKPAEMPMDSHNFLHQLFLDAGYTATRSNSLFCTTKERIAYDWGSGVYVLFMHDGWHGTTFMGDTREYSYYKLKNIAHRYLNGFKETRGNKEIAISDFNALQPMHIDSPHDLEIVLQEQVVDLILTGNKYIGLRLDEGEFTADVLKLVFQNE